MPRTLVVVTIEHLAARVTAAASEVALFLDSWLVATARPLGGRVARVDGDHVVVVFRDAAAALRCGLQLQDTLFASAGGGQEGGPPACKVMVTTGSVVPWQGDVLTPLVAQALNHCRAEKRPFAVLVDEATRSLAPLAGRAQRVEGREGAAVYALKAASTGPPYAALVAEASAAASASSPAARLSPWLGRIASAAASLAAAARARQAVALGVGGVAVLGASALVVALLTGGEPGPSAPPPVYAEDDIRGWPVEDLVAYLGDDDVDDILAELERRPPGDVKDAMVKEVEQGSYLRRHRALRILAQGGNALDEHYQTVAIRDVENGPSCDAWLEGLEVLEARAVDDRALDALTALKRRKGAQACVDFPATEAAIRARLATR